LAKFVELDNKGMETWEDEYEGRLQVHYRQDVEPILERNKILRNGGLTDSGIKRDMWLYASIPPVVILKLRFEYGLDVFDRNDIKRVMEVINRDFPHVKCTNKTHTITH
jgi:hypothetical protein